MSIFRRCRRPKATSTPDTHNLTTPKLMLALEPRILFDAAGVATAVNSDPGSDGGLADGLSIDASQSDPTPAEAAEQIPFFVPPATAAQGARFAQSITNQQHGSSPPIGSDNTDPGDDTFSVPAAGQTAREIVFVDAAVDDARSLLRSIADDVEVIMLSAESDGIDQVTQALEQYRNLDAIHIISHGGPGYFFLGDTRVGSDTVESYATGLSTWGNSLTAEADLLIYGCEVAADVSGETLLNRMGELTGADVAGSLDTTGAATAGGDWDLEVASGPIETDLPLDPSGTSITLVGVSPNEAPAIAGDLSATVAEGRAVTITTTDLTENDPDDGGTGLTYTITGGLNNG